jgi:hypothetical protein
MSYKPYRHVPLSKRCPHGYDKHVAFCRDPGYRMVKQFGNYECRTCVDAEIDAREYLVRMRAIERAHGIGSDET